MVSGETRVTSGNSFSIGLNEITRIASKFDDSLKEIFFAKQVVLTEGPADKIATQCALEKLNLNLDKENISVVDCGSNSAIPDIAKILKNFRIPCYLLIDEDPENTNTQKLIKNLKSLLGSENIFLQSPNLERLFGLPSKPSKKESLEFFHRWFQSNSPPEVYLRLKERMGY
jgi:predicted ATP-dependent endonuclease of OLD family